MKTASRTKTVYGTNEIAHLWAHQSTNCARNANDNFYFRDKTIYSYGSHFPIATIANEDSILFTLETYSHTTAGHIQLVRAAISHKEVIYCYDVPVCLEYASNKHDNNLNFWKRKIKGLFDELGSKKIRNTDSRISQINVHASQLKKYVDFFKFKIKDKELLAMLSLVNAPDFISKVRDAKDKEEKAKELKLKNAAKAYSKYISLWRKYDNEGIKNLSDKDKDLCNYYNRNSDSFTRLRYDAEKNRVETSKGVLIPVEIAKRAFITLNGCFQNNCNNLSIDVMNYTITKSTKQFIVAGCHTIPNEDVLYIAELLGWTKERLHVNDKGNLQSL